MPCSVMCSALPASDCSERALACTQANDLGQRTQHTHNSTHVGHASADLTLRAWHAQRARRCRYVRYMGAIRLIQESLVRKAAKHGLPLVDNTNVDRSVATIHLTIMG